MLLIPHTIYRQRLQLCLTDPATSMPQQREAEQALLAPELLAALSAELDQALAGLPPGTWLIIEHLTLDAGTLRPTDLAGQLRQLLPNLLRQQLLRRLAGPAQLAGEAAAGQPGGPAQLLLAGDAATTVTEQPAELAVAAAWVYFLVHGQLPPHWPVPASPRTWEAELQPLLQAPPAGLAAALRNALWAPVARQRLLRQFSPALVAATLLVLLPASQVRPSQLARVLAELLRVSPSAAAADNAGEAVALALVERVLAPTAGLDWAALLAAPPRALPRRNSPENWAWLLAARLLASPGGLSAAQGQPGGPAVSSPVLQSSQPASPSPLATNSLTAAPGATAVPLETSLGLAPAGLAPAGLVPEAMDAAAYVSNAGVALLHPFLPACFASCGWLGPDNQFVSPQAQAEAVLLVHFLATGHGHAPEYALHFPRLLCGVPANSPPPRQRKLSRQARVEGRALLRAALLHWGALRGTSIAGLREAFLQREGKLEHLPDGPVLTVAQLPQDVLLDRLPYGWGVSLVHLPWLAKRLVVNWA